MSFEEETISLQDQFDEAIASNDKLTVQDFLNNQNISDVAQLISDNEEYETQIISILSPHRAVSTFKILDVPEQKRIIKSLPPLKTAELLNELPADDRTAFLEEMPTSAVRELIKLLDPEERKITLALLGYPEGSVGRLMIPDYIAVHEDWTVEEVLDEIRTEGKHIETIDVIYVINERGAFVDDIRIREIILANPDTILSEIIDKRFIALNVHDTQEEANNIFKMNNRVALPVVDDNNILLGIVTIDDVLWVANEEFTENMQKIGGTEALDEPYLEMPLFKLFRKRAGWLVVLFMGEMLTATAMSYFEDEITKAIVLALFVPLIISSGGNSGSQASTLIIQAMAMGEVYISDWLRVLKREILSGLMLGTVLGLIGFMRVELWSYIFPDVYGVHSFFIALTVGFSLIGVVLWGTLSGSMLPLFLKKLGADPAASSAPFVATLVDVTGLIIYFSMAYIFLQGILL
ncbi:magnesium transporter [Agriterribacter humi]|uniref:magnesium transporter n=1 Tax=Agriterribacter humi TaxID=1104781 RepID=UPI001264C24E|nr:magnesium transporter [Agriterribacter humi]